MCTKYWPWSARVSSRATVAVTRGSGRSRTQRRSKEAAECTHPAPSRSASPVRSMEIRSRSTTFGCPEDRQKRPTERSPEHPPTTVRQQANWCDGIFIQNQNEIIILSHRFVFWKNKIKHSMVFYINIKKIKIKIESRYN